MDAETLLAALKQVKGFAKGMKAQGLKKKYLQPQDGAEGSPDEEASESPEDEAGELGDGQGDASDAMGGLEAKAPGDMTEVDIQAPGSKLQPEDIQKLMALLGKK